MQTGKEPLRSFSDLLQFMKKDRDEPVAAPKLSSPKPAVDAGSEGMAASVESIPDQVESTDRGDASDAPA